MTPQLTAKAERRLHASTVFTPATPVRDADLFSGRAEQIRRVVDVVNQPGQHAVIFGERGVGKTSLANVITNRVKELGTNVLASRITCDTNDTYPSLWRKMLSQVHLQERKPGIGFSARDKATTRTAVHDLGPNPSSDDIRHFLTYLSDTTTVIVVMDEFDRIMEVNTRRAMADTIKAFSDHCLPATIILVGVADNVDTLIQEHQSIERCLVQVRMPRMSPSEIESILETGGHRLGMTFHPDAMAKIAAISQGLPHYAHLIALQAVRVSMDAGDGAEVRVEHLDEAIARALDDAQQSLRSGYRKAVQSPRKDNIFTHVLLACALSNTDKFGFFRAGDVRAPLSRLMGKPYEIPGFARHLNDFCEPHRGSVLRKYGAKHKSQYRFENPLMQPLVVMESLLERRVERNLIEELINERYLIVSKDLRPMGGLRR